MKKKQKEQKNVKFSLIYALVALFVFGAIIYRIVLISTSETVDGINIQQFANNRITRKEVLPSKRGTIYDVKGNALAQNVSSYTLIAYLSSSRTTNPDKPQHVVDKELTAEKLSPVLGLDKEMILHYLSREGAYQVEFGPKGRGLSELKKDEIVRLELPGIDFIETQQRYYPYGDFLAYTIGYAKKKEIKKEDGTTTEEIVGEMGIESYHNKDLTGENGYTLYQKDRKGYKIAGTKEVVVEAIDGKDIYLTIDSTIQLFVEQAANDMLSKNKAEWVNIMLADAKTGAILASYTNPSFDPNKRDVKSYLDNNVSVAFEPGSTMKIYSYLAVMEAGKYNGKDKYKSGVLTAKDGTKIGDWKREGWGTITYDQGFALSSNTAAMDLTRKYLGAEGLKAFYNKLGFGEKTGIELPNETSGKIAFKYETEILNASFGQGILTTSIQNVKALTAISNDGVLLQPYIIDKIVDPDTGEVVYQGGKKELDRVASKENVQKIRSLMRSVINGTYETSTGYYYYMKGYDFIGKTGTAQVARTDGKGYYKDQTILGLAGMFPGNDPQVIIYMAIKNQANNVTAPRKKMIQSIVKNVSKYLEIYDESKINTVKLQEVITPSFTNKDLEYAKSRMSSYGINTIVLGNGEKVVDQYPKAGIKINKIDRVILLTNYDTLTMPNLVGLSMKDVKAIMSLMNIKYETVGSGFVTSQDIKKETVLNKDEIVHLRFTTAPKEQPKEEPNKEEKKWS